MLPRVPGAASRTRSSSRTAAPRTCRIRTIRAALSDEEWARYLFAARTRAARSASGGDTRTAAGAGSSSAATPSRTRSSGREVHVRRHRVRGPRGETLAAALVRNGVLGGFRSPVPRTAARRLHGRRGGAERARPRRRAAARAGDARRGRRGARGGAAHGQGTAHAAPDATRYDTMHAHCDVLVVGAGRSGRAAAEAASGRVILVVRTCPVSGVSGRLSGVSRASFGRPKDDFEATLSPAWVVGIYDDNYVIAVESDRRVWRIRARRIVLATGAIERPAVFADNDRPGTMLAARRRGLRKPARRDRRRAAAGARASTSGARRADGCGGTTGSGRPSPTARRRGVECVGRVTGAAAAGRAAVRAPRRRRGRDVRRPRARRDRRRRPPRARRRPPRGRARQALHDDRHRLGAGQARQRQRDPRRGGAARRPSRRARHDDVPPAVRPDPVRRARRP